MVEGNAYLFLILVLLAPIAGLILVANSLFCLFRNRHLEPSWVALVFLLIGLSGLVEAWYFLPQFKMH